MIQYGVRVVAALESLADQQPGLNIRSARVSITKGFVTPDFLVDP